MKTNIGNTARIVLSQAQKALPQILCELIARSDRKNIIILNAHLKKKIAAKQKVSEHYINVCLARYIKQNYLIWIAESSYFLSPHVAFKCSNPEFMLLIEEYEQQRAARAKKRKPTRKPKPTAQEESKPAAPVFGIANGK